MRSGSGRDCAPGGLGVACATVRANRGNTADAAAATALVAGANTFVVNDGTTGIVVAAWAQRGSTIATVKPCGIEADSAEECVSWRAPG